MASNPETNRKRFVKYWETSIPWSFDGEKLDYEKKRRLRYSLQDYMLDAIPFASYKSKLVLELGSGGGIDSAEFGRNGADIISLDFTHAGSKTTAQLLREASIPPNVVRSFALTLPFRDNSLDCVYSFGVLHHIPEVDKGLGEVCRVLKSDGELICMLYNKQSLLYAYSILFLHRNGKLAEDDLVRMYSERILNCPYTRAYTKKEAHNLFSKYFRDVETKVYYNVIDLPERRKVKIDIQGNYDLGWHIIVKATRKIR